MHIQSLPTNEARTSNSNPKQGSAHSSALRNRSAPAHNTHSCQTQNLLANNT